MKTKRNIKKYLLSASIMFLIVGFAYSTDRSVAKKDSVPYNTYKGRIIDNETEEPVVFTTIYVEGTSIGTVSNSDGAFTIKVPENQANKSLHFSHIGYEETDVNLSVFKGNEPVVRMQIKPTTIDQVTIRTTDASTILNGAYKNISKNYSSTPEMQRAFYRETIEKNSKYVAILESVIDVYKGAYSKDIDADRTKIYKARKSRDVKRMDTVVFKLQGGPTVALLLDLAKHPYNLITPDVMPYYDYKLSGVISVNDQLAYVVDFKQKKEFEYPLYEGKIFLDYETLAITGLEFKISDQKLDEASEILVRKKPATMSINTEGANYMANYREIDGKWYLHYVRAQTEFKCKWNRKLFAADYVTTMEMAITNRSQENVAKYKYKESFKSTQVMADNIEDFQDDDFWGSDNTIRPDESIETAIKRLNRRLK